LADQGFNIMGAVSWRKNGALEGRNRDFVNGNQPERGLSIDTRGTPIATIFANGSNAIFAPTGSLLSGLGSALVIPGTTLSPNGVNTLDLPGGAGCESFDGGMAYNDALWAFPAAQLGCAWDTSRDTVLQQPQETLTYYGRATAAFGDHQVFAEVTGSKADSAKRFSANQYAGNTTSTPLYYPLNALTADTYNRVYNELLAVFPAIAVNYGKPIAYRWRCSACGAREYETTSTTFRVAAGIEGPIAAGWDYRAGASFAKSEADSVLGNGYHFRGIFSSTARATASGIPGAAFGTQDTRAPTAPGATAPGIVGLLNSGILNPFSEVQSPAALAALESLSARGTTLFGGRYEVKQFDASVSGSLFSLPGGEVQIALGVDYRKETYSFNGSAEAELNRPEIFNVAFDNANALTPRSRDIKAAYAELLVPLIDMFEITGAVRIDDYSGFGSTVNPKISAKFMPADWLLFRGSYNTGFRAPSFNQVFNGETRSANPGNNRVDPTTCNLPAPNPAVPGCEVINPDSISGGNLNLGPETSSQYSVGVVLRPSAQISASFDFWSVAVDDAIGDLTIDELLRNAQFFPERLLRGPGNVLTLLDLRTANIGSRRTQGLEVSLRAGTDAFGGIITAGLDGTRLLKKKEKFLPAAPFGPSQIGVFSFAGDLGLKWKHSAFISWSNDDVDLSFSQIYRSGYENQKLPGVANGTVNPPGFNERVKPYIIYNLSAGVKVNDMFRITGGIRNLFDTDPPFAITYNTDTGAGGSWDPRVADPRGRSYTLTVDTKF
jgi:iron complex outermembrane recepter protein